MTLDQLLATAEVQIAATPHLRNMRNVEKPTLTSGETFSSVSNSVLRDTCSRLVEKLEVQRSACSAPSASASDTSPAASDSAKIDAGPTALSVASCPASAAPAAPSTVTASPIPATSPAGPEARPPLVPLEAPFVDGVRYRLAGAHEIPSRLPLFVQDAHGDTRRAHGVLIYDPLRPERQRVDAET